MKILAVDFGTSSVKAGIYNENLQALCSASEKYAYKVNGLFADIDANEIYAAFLKCAAKLSGRDKADVIAIDNFSPSVIPMDREGEPLYNCIIHLDRRSYAQSRFALKQLPAQRFLDINGNLPFAGGIGLTSMLWLKDNYPDIYSRTYKLGHLSTYMLRKLTGGFYMDPSNASFTGLYETFSAKGWSPEITRAVGIDESLLPELRSSLSLAGGLTADAARALGMKQGTPVIIGGNDTSSAAYGAGATEPGDILSISGSSEIMTVTTETPVAHPKYYSRTSIEDGKWLHLTITVGGFAVTWFRKEFCREMTDAEFYGDYFQRVVSEPMSGTVRFLPHLAGDRHSLVKKRGGFSGLTVDTTREDMLRALVYGTFDPMRASLALIAGHTPLSGKMYITGGMISPQYQRFKESVFSGYEYISRADCSLIGMAKAAVNTLNR